MPPVPVVGIDGPVGIEGVVDITSGTAFIGEGAVRTAGLVADGAMIIGAPAEGAATAAANADEPSESTKRPVPKYFTALLKIFLNSNHLIKFYFCCLMKNVFKNASYFVITFAVSAFVISAVITNHSLDVLLQENRP